MIFMYQIMAMKHVYAAPWLKISHEFYFFVFAEVDDVFEGHGFVIRYYSAATDTTDDLEID